MATFVVIYVQCKCLVKKNSPSLTSPNISQEASQVLRRDDGMDALRLLMLLLLLLLVWKLHGEDEDVNASTGVCLELESTAEQDQLLQQCSASVTRSTLSALTPPKPTPRASSC